MKVILISFTVFFLANVSMVYGEDDPMIGKTYRINTQSESSMGEVVERTNEYLKIKLPGGIKTYKLNQIQFLEEVSVPPMTPDQQKASNKFFELLQNKLDKSIESAQKNCSDCGEKIKKCEPCECSYFAPGGKTINQKIIGLEDNKCHYLQEIPGVFTMDCKFSQATVDAIVNYGALLAEADKDGKKVNHSFKFSTKDGESYSKVNVDGQTIEDPWQAAINSGECVTSYPDDEFSQ